jgi:thymidylate kinase
LPGQHLFFHSRPSVLPHRTRSTGPVTDPHRQAPYGRVPSIAKVLYLWIDYLLGWLVLVRPALRRGATVVIERGWWDLAVDQARYRLNAPPRLLHWLGRMLPRPDRTLILSGDADVIRRRKPELSSTELERQLAAWKALPAAPLRAVVIDVNGPAERVFSEAMAAAFE